MCKSWGRLIDKFEDVTYDLKIESTYILSYNIYEQMNTIKTCMHNQFPQGLRFTIRFPLKWNKIN